jgi:hypothetical protein
VVPTVALALTVKAFTVLLPLTLSLVNIAVLGVILPIGVFCKPPAALKVPLTVELVLTVSAFTVAFPETDNPLKIGLSAVPTPISTE